MRGLASEIVPQGGYNLCNRVVTNFRYSLK
jgi:hypothetical protein